MTGTATPIPVPSRAGFIWPATGPISSYFGPKHPLGIDIDFFANPNQPVKAVAAGTVTFAGGDACCSYGLYVIVEHASGLSTLYAHLSQISVSKGQRVTQGQVIGNGGRTGYATGNHLHFEVRKDGNVVDPLLYLP
jgi:murein DD-endopeptidase MepM/ murein hydrolase activator NlpD